MPLFADFDSIYTESTSEALPELSLSLREDVGTEAESASPTLVDRDASSVHDELIGFDPLDLPEPIQDIEPDAYQPINPNEYIQPSIDPMMQMELALQQGDAWAAGAAGQHTFNGRYHMWDYQDGPGKYHKHANGGTIYTTLDENWEVLDIRSTGGTLSKITPESEGGGAKIMDADVALIPAIDNNVFEVNRNLIGHLAVDDVGGVMQFFGGISNLTVEEPNQRQALSVIHPEFTTPIESRGIIHPDFCEAPELVSGLSYAEAVGLDSSFVDVVNKVGGIADPGGDDI